MVYRSASEDSRAWWLLSLGPAVNNAGLAAEGLGHRWLAQGSPEEPCRLQCVSSDTRWIMGLLIALGALLLQQTRAMRTDIAALKANVVEIRADIRELHSLHLMAAQAARGTAQDPPAAQQAAPGDD